MAEIQLFDDQQSLLDLTRYEMRRHKSVLLQAETGFGKTVLTAAMISGARGKGTRAMMVVPRKELLHQTSKTFNKYGIHHTYVAAEHCYNPFEKIVLATSGTLVRRLDRVQRPDVLFVDETHYGAGQLDRIIKHYKAQGSWIIGLSATPLRLDGRGLGCWYETMVEGPSKADLIARGRLSDFRLFAPDAPDLSGIKTSDGDYARAQLAAVMQENSVLIGNAAKHYRAHAMGMISVAYCVSIKHAQMTAEALSAAGIPSACIHGGMTDDERKSLIIALARRQILVLTCVDLLIFGFDLSSAAEMDVTIECMIDLGPTKSLAKQMQKWGRVLRAKPVPAIILDHAGNAQRHGMPDEPRDWTLEDKPKRKKGDSEPTQPVRQCSECYFVHRPTPTCPACGFIYPIQSREIEEVEGDLREVTSARKLMRREQAAAETLDDLIALGRARGMKNPAGWARHDMRARAAKGAR